MGFFVSGNGTVTGEMKTTSKMSLRVWTNLSDDFDHEQLADNWAKLDAHDHTNGRGVQIPTEGIAKEAITPELLAGIVAERLFGETEAYSTEATVVASKPTTPATRSIVQATVKVIAEKVKIEIKVEGKTVTIYEGSTAGQVPIHFFVPAKVAWEWVRAEGVEGNISFKYRTVPL